jgi:hypothetical protein
MGRSMLRPYRVAASIIASAKDWLLEAGQRTLQLRR